MNILKYCFLALTFCVVVSCSGDGAAHSDVEGVSVRIEDFNALEDRLRSCVADQKLSADQRRDAEYLGASRGEEACRKRAEFETSESVNRAVAESLSVIEELSAELKKLRLPYAVVSGNCEGYLEAGGFRNIQVTNACLSVVTKKVSNDGEIVGIVGATSPEAKAAGLKRLDCDFGAAVVRLTSKPCGP